MMPTQRTMPNKTPKIGAQRQRVSMTLSTASRITVMMMSGTTGVPMRSWNTIMRRAVAAMAQVAAPRAVLTLGRKVDFILCLFLCGCSCSEEERTDAIDPIKLRLPLGDQVRHHLRGPEEDARLPRDRRELSDLLPHVEDVCLAVHRVV